MSDYRFAILGAGFWTKFQLSGWKEIPGARCVAIYNRTVAKAEAYSREFGIPAVYSDASALLRNEKLDFVDIVTGPETHEELAMLALQAGLPVICQKPLTLTLQSAETMVRAFQERSVQLLVNENWRWQRPIRAVKQILETGDIGRVFRARVEMISGFAVFGNQPALKAMPQFLLMDLGTHIFDVCRFLFGEATSVYCKNTKVHADNIGEDVATAMLQMHSGATVVASMAYAENFLEDECFPQTKIFIEGEAGSVELKSSYRIHCTTRNGTRVVLAQPPHFAWAAPAYDVVHASIVPCQRNLFRSLQGLEVAETTGIDNLQTLRLVHAAYQSATSGQAVSA